MAASSLHPATSYTLPGYTEKSQYTHSGFPEVISYKAGRGVYWFLIIAVKSHYGNPGC